MKNVDIGKIVLLLSWLSIFALLWLMLFDIVSTQKVGTWSAFAMFLTIALFAGASQK